MVYLRNNFGSFFCKGYSIFYHWQLVPFEFNLSIGMCLKYIEVIIGSDRADFSTLRVNPAQYTTLSGIVTKTTGTTNFNGYISYMHIVANSICNDS